MNLGVSHGIILHSLRERNPGVHASELYMPVSMSLEISMLVKDEKDGIRGASQSHCWVIRTRGLKPHHKHGPIFIIIKKGEGGRCEAAIEKRHIPVKYNLRSRSLRVYSRV